MCHESRNILKNTVVTLGTGLGMGEVGNTNTDCVLDKIVMDILACWLEQK